MRQLQTSVLLLWVLTAVLSNISEGKKGFGGKSTSSKKPSKKPSQGSKTQPNYPKQTYSTGPGTKTNQQGGGSNPRGNTNRRFGADSYPAGGWYPAGGSYTVRNAGQPGGYPRGQPTGGGYPNWNPNKILSPQYGGSFRGDGYGMGGSPFSQSVKNMGYGTSVQSKGFGKQAVLAAGVAGIAVGYGVGHFQWPNTPFRSPQEERYYSNYMNQHQTSSVTHGTTTQKPSFLSKSSTTKETPSQTQSYDQFMSVCIKQQDLIKEQVPKDPANLQKEGVDKKYSAPQTGFTESPKPAGIDKEEDDTVSLIQIGYPALIEQMKSRKCVELYMVYSESFPVRKTEDQKNEMEVNIPRGSNNHNGQIIISEVLLLLTLSLMLFYIN